MKIRIGAFALVFAFSSLANDGLSPRAGGMPVCEAKLAVCSGAYAGCAASLQACLDHSGGSAQTAAASCKAILDSGHAAGDQAYWIAVGASAQQIFCDMTSGGWTLVLKTDASSIAHYNPLSVSPASLATTALDTVAKLDDGAIRALQAGGETRVESPDVSFTVFAQGAGWSIPSYPGYPTVVGSKVNAGDAYGAGGQCYDSLAPCSSDHYCFGIFPVNGSGVPFLQHVCIRRFATAGIWFHSSDSSPDGNYFRGRVWVR